MGKQILICTAAAPMPAVLTAAALLALVTGCAVDPLMPDALQLAVDTAPQHAVFIMVDVTFRPVPCVDIHTDSITRP